VLANGAPSVYVFVGGLPSQPADACGWGLALGSIACLSCVVPALKAALVDPATALGAE